MMGLNVNQHIKIVQKQSNHDIERICNWITDTGVKQNKRHVAESVNGVPRNILYFNLIEDFSTKRSLQMLQTIHLMIRGALDW